MSNIHLIKTASEAEEALTLIVERKFYRELATIQQAAQAMSQARAGVPGRQQALRAVLIGFTDNVDALEQAS